MESDADEVRRKLLGLEVCYKCKEEFPKDKLFDFSVVTIGDKILMCECCIDKALLQRIPKVSTPWENSI